jgi:type II secretory pathway pseudopilin PulG
MSKKKIIAFTICEVLIVLGILGIVAEMTIPDLVTSFQKQVAVVKFKKSYTNISQAIKRSEIDNGPVSTWDFSTDSLNFMNTYITPYFIAAKNCDTTQNGCWPNDEISYLNGSNESVTDYAKIALPDGTFLALFVHDFLTNNHAHFYIDIDGYKGHNTFGKDVFIFTLTPNSLYETSKHKITRSGFYPFGYGLERNELFDSSNGSGCVYAGSGSKCGALIMLDGWRIADDYPW